MIKNRSLVLALAGALFLSTPAVRAGTLTENFAADPLHNGWQTYGDANLFQWDATNQVLRVTWDSSQPDSYFYYPLGTILDRADDFSVAFDLRLDDIAAGDHPNTFQIAIGLLNLGEADGTNFLRGTGYNSPDLVELDYFWDSGFGATVWPTMIDTNSGFNYTGSGDYALWTLTNGNWHHFEMNYTASNQTLITAVTNLASHSGLLLSQGLAGSFPDFRVTAFSVSSYSEAGQDPTYAGSVLAHGAIDNVVATAPPPPVQNLTGSFTNGRWTTRFIGRTNWLYTLERTADFHSWTSVSPTVAGVAGAGVLSDTNPPAGNVFYRVRAQRP
jgi:hypothetical protein